MQTKLTYTLAVGTASLGLIAGLGLAGSGAANAATLGYSFINPEENTEINQSNTLGKFDSSLGTLTGVKLTLSGQATQNYTGFNSVDTQQSANISATTELYFTFSDGITLSVPDNASPAFALQSTSGLNSYAPGESLTFGPFTPSASETYLFPPNDSVAKFLGAAGDTFSVNCTSLSSLLVLGGGGNITATQSTTAGCGASVEYTYDPAPPPPQKTPEASTVLGLGLLGLGALFKRNKQQYSGKA